MQVGTTWRGWFSGSWRSPWGSSSRAVSFRLRPRNPTTTRAAPRTTPRRTSARCLRPMPRTPRRATTRPSTMPPSARIRPMTAQMPTASTATARTARSRAVPPRVPWVAAIPTACARWATRPPSAARAAPSAPLARRGKRAATRHAPAAAAGCTGCCSTTGTCETSTTTACGSAGAACVACAKGQECTAGKCACDATSCPSGCCDGNDVCPLQRSESATQCGTGGAACAGCGSGQACGAAGAPARARRLVSRRLLPGDDVRPPRQSVDERVRVEWKRLRDLRARCSRAPAARAAAAAPPAAGAAPVGACAARRHPPRRAGSAGELHDVRREPGVRHAGQVRLRRHVVPVGMLRLQWPVPDFGHRHLRHGGRRVRDVHVRADLRRRLVRVQPRLLPERLLQREHVRPVRERAVGTCGAGGAACSACLPGQHCSTATGKCVCDPSSCSGCCDSASKCQHLQQRHVRREWGRVLDLRHRTDLRRHRDLRLQRLVVSVRLLHRNHTMAPACSTPASRRRPAAARVARRA